ncbi:haloacid dehalogenase-like hydrolase [Thermomicrobium sp. 4228-Ro]|uniref:HAD family hydrolase n=1 Tax=Thermomicrobium sp. 4228-Ro TaxID=2993937 RepID=UPI0022495BAC|nr:HAD family hydrolase [Thermomicrobium sp. 4228-Ro]MCX2727378.1 haloacid dehalogenase-like hydrolase [Thermomicrobium sp. 4228-Ro]
MTLLVLFDIDGTLLRAGDPAHAQAMRDALAETLGEPVPLDGIPLAGMLDRQIARLALHRHGVPEEDIAQILPAVMQRMGLRYRELVHPGSRRDWVLPGVRPLLDRLWQRGHLAGVLTGNAQLVARWKLAAADLDGFLPFGAYGDEAEERHELVTRAREAARARFAIAPSLDETILIGDTPRDIAAAQASGTRVLAVATGRFGVDELRALQPDAVVPDLTEVERVVALLESLARSA